MIKLNQAALAGVLMAGLSVGAAPASAQQIFRFEAIQPGSTAGQFSIGWTQVVEKATPYKIQVSTGKPVTKTVLMAAKGDIEFSLYSPGIMAYMYDGAAMFQKVSEAKEVAKNVRGIVNFPLGLYQYIVYESSGIKSFNDLKGKKVFLGPPGGIAPRMSAAVIEAVSGLKANQDYTLMRFDWSAARPAFSDRQMDLTGVPTSAPSPMVEEYAASEPLRFLGIPDDKINDPAIREQLAIPGNSLEKLDPRSTVPGPSTRSRSTRSPAGWAWPRTRTCPKRSCTT
ncbi:MAG: TAXI family TRAP transporter solute-binding subunit [Burkholderiaceae bacterium]